MKVFDIFFKTSVGERVVRSDVVGERVETEGEGRIKRNISTNVEYPS